MIFNQPITGGGVLSPLFVKPTEMEPVWVEHPACKPHTHPSRMTNLFYINSIKRALKVWLWRSSSRGLPGGPAHEVQKYWLFFLPLTPCINNKYPGPRERPGGCHISFQSMAHRIRPLQCRTGKWNGCFPCPFKDLGITDSIAFLIFLFFPPHNQPPLPLNLLVLNFFRLPLRYPVLQPGKPILFCRFEH